MEFFVKLAGRKDLSGGIYRQIRRAIAEGRLRPGDRLPPSRELARSLEVSRMTVTVAYDRLAGEGFVSSRVGAGTYVSEQAAASTVSRKGLPAHGKVRPRAVWTSIPLPPLFDTPAPFDFRTGLPDTSLFPHKRWRRLMTSQLQSEAVACMYGDPAGHRALREAIARHVAISRGVDAPPEHVTITSGSQQALDIIARVLLAPGDGVAVEDPGYPPPRRLFESLGARVHAVPVDSHGLVVDALPRGARLVYVTPSHQFPLGVPMALSRRMALLAWAERHNASIIEDDYDSEFRFAERPIEPLQTLDTAGRVVYVGSFSKTLSPALRLGFVISPPALTEAVHKAKSVTDWYTSIVAQVVLARFIDTGGFARHIRRSSRIYRVRHALITDLLCRLFGDQVEIVPSLTGLHVTAVARRASTERICDIVRRASELGVAVQELARYAVKSPARAGLVLGYGAIPHTRIAEGLSRLQGCFES